MKLHCYALLDDVPISNNSGSSSDSSVVIGGVVGGVILLLMITVVLCIVILCMRRCHRKGHNKLSYKFNHEDVTINTVDCSYSLGIPITNNPTYDVLTKPYSETNEDEYNYVQPNEFNQHSDLDESMEMTTNPSYRVTTGEDRATVFGTTSDTKADHSSHDATTEEYDYAYAHDDHLLHHNTPVSTTGDTKVQIHAAMDKSRNTQTVYSPYLSLIGNSSKSK